MILRLTLSNVTITVMNLHRPALASALAAALALTAAGCASASHPAAGSHARTRTSGTAAALAAVHAGKALPCTATVTSQRPLDGTFVGIRVHTVRHARVKVVVQFKLTSRKKAARAGAHGRHTFWYPVGAASPGYQVTADVTVSRQGRKGSCQTSFTPRRPAVPAPPPAPSPSPSATATSKPPSAAWCTATASVYNASKDWNNVYVNSNQPYKSATASADGYSYSYGTDSQGYALIYLNGPPPGAEITVTVGGATCTTSD